MNVIAARIEPLLAIMEEPEPATAWGAIALGALLALGGTALFFWHRAAWSSHRADQSAPERDRRHYFRQYMRRSQVAAMLVLLGILIPVGMVVIDWEDRPGWLTAYWLLVLLVTFWMALLALGDLISQRAFIRAELSKVQRQHRQLEAELLELRGKTNGRRQQDGT